jgi:hypothetical protein
MLGAFWSKSDIDRNSVEPVGYLGNCHGSINNAVPGIFDHPMAIGRLTHAGVQRCLPPGAHSRDSSQQHVRFTKRTQIYHSRCQLLSK